jgi:hypothetical protein
MPYYQRSELVKTAIEVRQYVESRTADDQREALETAVAATLENVKTFGVFPQVAELIVKEIVDYSGQFQPNQVGEIIEKKANGEFRIPDDKVVSRFFNGDAGSEAAIRDYLKADGDPLPLEDYGAYLLRQSGAICEDGTIDIPQLTAWEARFRSALSMLPGLQSKIDEAGTAKQKLEKAHNSGKSALNAVGIAMFNWFKLGRIKSGVKTLDAKALATYVLYNTMVDDAAKFGVSIEKLNEIKNNLPEEVSGSFCSWSPFYTGWKLLRYAGERYGEDFYAEAKALVPSKLDTIKYNLSCTDKISEYFHVIYNMLDDIYIEADIIEVNGCRVPFVLRAVSKIIALEGGDAEKRMEFVIVLAKAFEEYDDMASPMFDIILDHIVEGKQIPE